MSFFFNIMLMWKIVEGSKASVLYIYIYIYRLMVTLDLLRVDRKAQGLLELESYLFPFGPTPSHIRAQLEWPKRLA